MEYDKLICSFKWHNQLFVRILNIYHNFLVVIRYFIGRCVISVEIVVKTYLNYSIHSFIHSVWNVIYFILFFLYLHEIDWCRFDQYLLKNNTERIKKKWFFFIVGMLVCMLRDIDMIKYIFYSAWNVYKVRSRMSDLFLKINFFFLRLLFIRCYFNQNEHWRVASMNFVLFSFFFLCLCLHLSCMKLASSRKWWIETDEQTWTM